AHQRLRSKAEFDHVYRRGQRYHQKLFQAAVCRNELGFARLGMSIAARTVGNAVARNRVRRLVREVFRHREDLPSADFVISAKSPVSPADNAQLRADLEQLLTPVGERYARSPPSS